VLRSAILMAFLATAPVETSVQQIADSGRCVSLAESADSRVDITPRFAPGQPPVLSFRFYEGKSHHRFGNSELLLDDAGH